MKHFLDNTMQMYWKQMKDRVYECLLRASGYTSQLVEKDVVTRSPVEILTDNYKPVTPAALPYAIVSKHMAF